MEDILASIKKIIAEDSNAKLSTPAPRRSEPRAPSHDVLGNKVEDIKAEAAAEQEMADSPEDVLELGSSLADGRPSAEPVSFAPVAPVTPVAAPEPQPVPVEAPILSSEATLSSRAALEALSALRVKSTAPNGDSLEGLVAELLRPMLKDWLDANLPAVVERMVAKEVARISGL